MTHDSFPSILSLVFDGFQIGPFYFWTHLFFFVLALWLSIELFLRLAQRAGLSLQQFKDRALWFVVAGILGGRLFSAIEQYRSYIKLDDPWRIFAIHDGNISFLGVAVGVAVVIATVRGQSRATLLQWLDVLLPATTFGIALTWIGNFAAGMNYGMPTDHFWGVTYDTFGVRYTVPIHPVQLYYAFFYLLLTFVILVVRKHAKRAGSETLVGIASASVATFVLEFFRGDASIPVFATLADFTMLLLLFTSLGVLALIAKRISQRFTLTYEGIVTVLCALYTVTRSHWSVASYELRFSQLLAVLALFGVIVYVVVHRHEHPHL